MHFNASWQGYVAALLAAAACTLIGTLMVPRFDIVNVAMVYLLAVVVVALLFTRGAAVFAALLCVAAFDYRFVPPQGTFTVDDWQYLLTFAIMVIVALVISGLLDRARRASEARAAAHLEAETERVRNALLSSISHDLRTPLAVMAGASSSLAEGGERMAPGERAALATSVYEQARAMSDQVAKVLQMTRLESGGIELERDWASVPEIVGAVLARLAPALDGHRLLLDVPADLPLVRVDAGLIDQALANLVENAARHTPAGTVVWVRARATANEVVLSVEDYGGGLPEDEVERVFAKFERGSGGAAGGVGLGLSICRAIVSLHGGRAWGERLPGGTAFRFSLPREAQPAPPSEPEGGTS